MSLNINNMPIKSVDYPSRREHPVDARLSGGQRTGVALSSLAGVAVTLAILAKTAKWKKFSLSHQGILNSKIKDTYLCLAKYEEPEIIAMGAGSIAGGLTGGILIDKRSENTSEELKSKFGEGLMQFANICVPILSVGQFSRLGKRMETDILAKFAKTKQTTGKIEKLIASLPKLAMTILGLGTGMFLGNRLANHLKAQILGAKEHREIKATDLFMHWDDLCVAASFFSDGPVVQGFARLVPLAMLSAGYQAGCKGLEGASRKLHAKEQLQQDCDKGKSIVSTGNIELNA